MTILKHELRQGRTAFIIWTAAVSFMLCICILIYPEMSSQMSEMSSMFADMGSFSQAFGMDQLNFGEFIGFFGVECGNILGLGGAFFAALLGIPALAKEEKEHTAEFLLTHPVSRKRIISEKWCAILAQILLFNSIVIIITVISILLIGEEISISLPHGMQICPAGISAETLALLFLAYFLLQVEIAAVTFGISAFLNRGNAGVGLGLAAAFYFLNIIANLTEDAEFLKYITPFGYTESADIIAEHTINGRYLASGIVFAAVGILLAFRKYQKKDIS